MEIDGVAIYRPFEKFRRDVMKVFRRWIERHKGKQLFSIWILYKPVVLIVRADAAKTAFTKSYS
ncbi:UNVERIFIED_CONTAM: hypothetical protein NCL1_48755 [Trichonephila clavipes]